MTNPSIRHIEIHWATLWRVFIFVALVALLYFARSAFAVLVLGVVISLGIEPLVEFLSEKLKIGRTLGVVAVLVFVLSILATSLYLVVPVVLHEIGGFVVHLTETLSSIPGITIPDISMQNLGLDGILNLVGNGESISMVISKIFKALALFFGTIVITLYLSIQKEGTEKMLKVILPAAYERPTIAVFEGFKKKMRRWLGTQVVLSVFIGLSAWLGMWLIGVRYPLVLGLLAAILEVVPIIGPIVAGSAAFFVASTDSLGLGLYVILFFFVLQQFENHVLVPLVMGKSMKVHPVLVVVSLLVGGEIAGFIGILLSIPIAVLVQEIFDHVAAHKEQNELS